MLCQRTVKLIRRKSSLPNREEEGGEGGNYMLLFTLFLSAFLFSKRGGSKEEWVKKGTIKIEFS